MRLYYDKPFRLVFGSDTEESKEALVELLNEVMGLTEDPVTEVTIKNPLILSEALDGKDIAMDINAVTKGGMQFDVEMQTGHYDYYLDRVVFNAAKLTAESLDKGEDYGKMKKSIVISFIKDKIFSSVENFHNVGHMALDGTDCIVSDKEELHFIELGKLSDKINPETATNLELLSLYIKYAEDEEKKDYVDKILKQGCKAVEKANRRLSMVTEEERRRIEQWYMDLAEHDRAQMIADARKQGFEEGIHKFALAVSNLMKNFDMDLEAAMDALGVDAEDRLQIAKCIKEL